MGHGFTAGVLTPTMRLQQDDSHDGITTDQADCRMVLLLGAGIFAQTPLSAFYMLAESLLPILSHAMHGRIL